MSVPDPRLRYDWKGVTYTMDGQIVYPERTQSNAMRPGETIHTENYFEPVRQRLIQPQQDPDLIRQRIEVFKTKQEEELKAVKIQQTLDIMGRLFSSTRRHDDGIYFSDEARYYDDPDLQHLICASANVVDRVHKHYGEQDSPEDLQRELNIVNAESKRFKQARDEERALKDQAILELSSHETKLQGEVNKAKRIERLEKNVVVGRIKDRVEQAIAKKRWKPEKVKDEILKIVADEYGKL
jgi:hypothetical protein